MASMEPSESEISQVIDFANLDPFDDRFMVTQALKNNNRDVETVLLQYFDNADTFRQKYRTVWDESMFAADREGTNNTPGISFHIESPGQNEVIQGVTPPPDSYALGAPSRPPSRSNSRSPLGRMVDWSANESGAPNSQQEEDENMQRALRESAQEAGISVLQQETGITEGSANAPHFGPANRSDYDQTNWAMVPVGPAAETKMNNTPAPSLRKRTIGAPAFLIQGFSSSGDHRLGGLLTILHEIPLARNILLQTGNPAASYGHNSEWWKGQEILPPHVLAQLQTGQLTWNGESSTRPDFEEELHRLMAFLDSTERSHGTVSVMADLVPYLNLGAEKQFYEHLGSRNEEKIGPLMNVATLVEVQGEGDGQEDAKFGILEMDHLRSDYSNIKTLYEALDHVMWNDALSWNEVHEGSKMAMFRKMGDVFVIKVGGDGPEESFEIPAELYPERYLDTRKDEARRIQLGWCQTKQAMLKIVQEEQNLYQGRDPVTNQIYDKREMIQKATEQWKEYGEYLKGLARFHVMEESGFQTDKFPDYRAAPCEMEEDAKRQFDKVEQTVDYSEKLLEQLSNKMKSLQVELENIKARQRFLGRLLTVPNKSGRPKPMTCEKLLLRGVATSNDVVYVCQRGEADLIELEDEPQQRPDQWWRLAYTPNEEQPVKAEKIEIERLFRDVWQETKTPILVYATENALDTPRAVLSSALERFIKAENKAFRQELNQEKLESSEKRKPGILDPLSPSKRKHRDSFDSMDSNRASLGSDEERSGFDNPFADQEDSVGTEMTDMSTNVPDYARSASVESPPALPARRPAATDDGSATMTPNTITAESTDRGNSPKVTTTEIEEDKAPEMKERSGQPPFMSMSRSTSVKRKSPESDVDMDVSEHRGG